MSKRFYYDEFSNDIFDEQIDDYPSNFEICEIEPQKLPDKPSESQIE